MTNKICPICDAADAFADTMGIQRLRGSDAQIRRAAPIREALLSWRPALEHFKIHAPRQEIADGLGKLIEVMEAPYAGALIDAAAGVLRMPTLEEETTATYWVVAADINRVGVALVELSDALSRDDPALAKLPPTKLLSMYITARRQGRLKA